LNVQKKQKSHGKRKEPEKRSADLKAPGDGMVQKVDSKSKSVDSNKRVQKTPKPSKKKEKKEIIQGALDKYYRSEELKPYQAELIKMQRHLEKTGKKMVILFDGRDASGKGGTIRRITRYMNEKRYRVVALGKPNEQQKTESDSLLFFISKNFFFANETFFMYASIGVASR
jgi:polyphosphate kinase 2 (PPK2 family)